MATTVEPGAVTTPLSEAEFIELASADTPEHKGAGPHKDAERKMEPAKATEDPKPKADEDPEKTGSDADDTGSTPKAGDATPAKTEDPEHPDSLNAGDEDADAPTAEETAAFEKALLEQGVKVALEELPEAARPAVKKTLTEMNRGFTTKMQELSAELKSARAFKAEERFRKERPADFIFAMLAENPDVAIQVNKLIEQTADNEVALSGHKAIVENARRHAADAEEQAVTRAETQKQVEGEIIAMGRAAAKAHNVPFEAGVADGIATAILLETQLAAAEKREARRITKEQILGIAKQKSVLYENLKRQLARDKSGKYVSDKVADRKEGLVIKPGVRGSPPAPGAKTKPKNDDEFIERFVAAHGG